MVGFKLKQETEKPLAINRENIYMKHIKLNNREGFIRIAELLIAVTLITIIFLIVYKQNIPKQETQDLTELARDILAEIGAQEDLRSEIISNQTNATNMIKTLNFINNSVPDYINFELRACTINSACGQSTYVGNVFSAERIISSSISGNFSSVKLRLFLWIVE
jgi:cell division protein FtsL